MDIVFMLASGVLFVRAFQPEDVPMERKQRKKYLLAYVSLLFLIVLVDYFRVWIFMNMGKSDWDLYGYNLFDIFSVFVYFLILQAERIIPIVRRRKTLQVQWGLIALSVVSIFLAILWVTMNLQESPSPIVQNLRGSDLWKAAYSFAAAIFFARAFRVKKETDNVSVI